MTNSEIKKCPFCGITPVDSDIKNDFFTHPPSRICWLSTMQFPLLDWNTRTPEPTRPVAIAFDKVRKEKISITYIDFTEGVFLENDNSYTRPISELDIIPEPTNIHKLDFEITKIFEELRVMHDVPKSVLESLEGLIRNRNPEPTKADKGLVPVPEHLKLPIKFVKEAGMFFDAENNHVLDIRGWGAIQYFKDAEKIQDDIGEFIASQINATPTTTKDGDIYNIIDSPFLTTHILRNWERERIEKFAKHLLGDLHLSITKEQLLAILPDMVRQEDIDSGLMSLRYAEGWDDARNYMKQRIEELWKA